MQLNKNTLLSYLAVYHLCCIYRDERSGPITHQDITRTPNLETCLVVLVYSPSLIL